MRAGIAACLDKMAPLPPFETNKLAGVTSMCEMVVERADDPPGTDGRAITWQAWIPCAGLRRGGSRIPAMGIKSIFDGLYVDQLFQKNERGETVFYPFGLMGGGYRLPVEREGDVRQSMRRLMLVSLVVGISFGLLALRMVEQPAPTPLMGWLIGGGVFALLLGVIVHFQSRLAKGLEPAVGPRPSARAWLRSGRAARALWTHWTCVGLGLFALLMAGAGFAFGLADGDPWGFASGAFMLLVGAALTWDGVLGLIERSKAAKAE
jgi:hypothetical protein